MATRRRGRGRAKAIEDRIDGIGGANDCALIDGASRGRRATRSATARASAGSQKKGEAHSSRGSDAASSPGSWTCRGKDDSQTNAWDMQGGSARSSAHSPEISVDLEGIPCKSARLSRRADPGSGRRPDMPAQSRHSPVGDATIPEDQGYVPSPQIACAWASPGKHEESLAAKLSLGCGAATRPNRPSLAAAGAVPIKQRKMMLMKALSGSSGGDMIDTSPSMAAACGVAECTPAMAPGIDSNTLRDAHIRATLLEVAGETDESQATEVLDESADSALPIVAAKGAMTPGITGRINQRMRELQDVVQKLGCEESLSPYVLTSGAYEDCSPTYPAWSAPVESVADTASSREPYARRDDDDDDDDEVAFAKLDKRFSNITSRRSTRASSRITFEHKQPNPLPDANLDCASALHHPAYGRRVLSAFGRSVYVASASVFLASVPLWLEQRLCDMDRVKEMAASKMQSPVFPGAVSVFQFPPGTKTSITVPQTTAIFDGQHRCHALHLILEAEPTRNIDILVEVFSVTSRKEIIELYVDVNKAQPVQEIDVPDAISTLKKRCIDEACLAMRGKYPACFSTKQNCRAPNIYLASLRNSLFRSRVFDTRGITTPEQLVELLEAVNKGLAERDDSSWPSNRARALTKARDVGFFLGMTALWLEEL